jgi:hypothetical protein
VQVMTAAGQSYADALSRAKYWQERSDQYRAISLDIVV